MGSLLNKPLQYLENFRFTKTANSTSIVASIKVDVLLGEIILPREPNPKILKDEYSVILEFDVIENPTKTFSDFYTFPHEAAILIEPLIMYSASVNDPDDIIEPELRAKIQARTNVSGKFSVTTIIYKKGIETGQVTTTISQDETIVII